MRRLGRIGRRQVAVTAVAAAALAFSLHAGRIALDQQQRAAARRMALPPRSTAQAEAPPFSGALAAPQAGTTGTAPLPDLPIPALAALEGTGRSCPPGPFARAAVCSTRRVRSNASRQRFITRRRASPTTVSARWRRWC